MECTKNSVTADNFLHTSITAKVQVLAWGPPLGSRLADSGLFFHLKSSITHTFLEMSSGLPRSWSSAFEWPSQPGVANCPHLGPTLWKVAWRPMDHASEQGPHCPVITLWPWDSFLYFLAHIFIPKHPLFPNTGLPMPSSHSLFSVFSCFYTCSCHWRPVSILPVLGSSHPLPCGEMSLPTLGPEFHHTHLQAPWVVYAFSLVKK